MDLSRQGVFDELCVKHIILNLANCLELIVKYRLEQEHWTLIFSDLNKAKYSDYLEGDFISVDVKSGISRFFILYFLGCFFLWGGFFFFFYWGG